MSQRAADIRRETAETAIRARIDLDGSGRTELDTGIGFFDHMLAQVARHGLVDLAVSAAGDLGVDGHHTVEDIGITLGQTVAQALGEPRGIARSGHAYVPLDEALSRVVIDFSGRPGLVFGARFTRERVGTLDTELVAEFFRGFVNHARCTLHVDTLRGDNDHHVIETQFKAFGRALRAAVARDERLGDVVPSTKGSL
jgi:imidazoleglycerol-phosphate dehydratase